MRFSGCVVAERQLLPLVVEHCSQAGIGRQRGGGAAVLDAWVRDAEDDPNAQEETAQHRSKLRRQGAAHDLAQERVIVRCMRLELYKKLVCLKKR